MLSIRLPSDVETRLTLLAQRTGRTKAFYAREAIVAYLDIQEEAYKGDTIKLSQAGQHTVAEALVNPPEPGAALEKAYDNRAKLLRNS